MHTLCVKPERSAPLLHTRCAKSTAGARGASVSCTAGAPRGPAVHFCAKYFRMFLDNVSKNYTISSLRNAAMGYCCAGKSPTQQYAMQSTYRAF